MADGDSSSSKTAATKDASQSSYNGDVNSPFYLQPSDHPGLIFVVTPLEENGTNYFTWKRNILNAFESKTKTGFLDGTITKPEVDSQNYIPWIKCNAMVRSWLVNSISKELQNSIVYAETAKEIWKDLEERFSQGNAPRVYEIRRAIALFQQEKASISTYYRKLRTLWDELQAVNPVLSCVCNCQCDAAKKIQVMRENKKVHDFLMGLDGEFTTVRSQILSMEPLPSLGCAYAIVAKEEKQRTIAASRIQNIAPAIFVAGRMTNNLAYNGSKSGNGPEKPTCDFCKKVGHTKDKCYEIIGYPSHWRKKPNKINTKCSSQNANACSHIATNMSQVEVQTLNTEQSHTRVEPQSIIPRFTGAQYQQLLSLLNNNSGPNSSVNLVNFSGLTNEEADWNG